MTIEEYYESLKRIDKLRQFQFAAWLNSLVTPVEATMLNEDEAEDNQAS